MEENPQLPQHSSPTPDLSIVATLYNSKDFIADFYRRTTETAERITASFEILLVNDGSPDNSLAIAKSIADLDPRVRVVNLSRNFGHHSAMLAGLRHTRGRYVFLIDVDLEEQPEWLLDFWQEMQAAPVDVIYGVQIARNGSIMKRYGGSAFYRIFNLTSDTGIPVNGCTIRLMRRPFVDAVSQFNEAHVFLMGLFSWAGFSQRPRYVNKQRRSGRSNYNLFRSTALSIDAITSFSGYPLTVIFVAGLSITFLSLVYACSLVASKLLNPALIVSGFTSIMVSLWFLGGVIISFIGVIGLYIGKLFAESKRRPQYLVETIYERNE